MIEVLPQSGRRIDQWRQRLLWRIHCRYRTVQQILRVGEMELLFTRIENADRVLDQVAAEEDRREKMRGQRLDGEQLHLPYWAELWESAAGVGQYVVRNWQELSKGSSPRVLDLGCGMGLTGTVAARLGAKVLFADLESPALLFARLNSLSDFRRVRTRRLNWRTDRLEEKFDLILGADILYEKAQWPHIDAFVQAHLADGGEVVLGEPGRQTGDLFVEWVRATRWAFTEFGEPVPMRSKGIRIFRLKQT